MKKIIKCFMLCVFVIASGSCTDASNSSFKEVNKKYQCPMDCENGKVYDKPGICPVCGMDLKEINNSSSSSKNDVKISGAMMNVMHKGELFGTISLDTISNKTHLYGIGPVDFLRGEILIDDGICYVSKVDVNNSVLIEEDFKVKAPFFVYQNVEKWEEVIFPDTIQSVPQLEAFLDETTKNHSRPFAFKITATVDADIHIVNLPAGAEVHSPDDAHKNQKSYELKNESAELIGFFSTEHQGVFTHHDNITHIHLITTDKKKMGHVDEMVIKQGSGKLYLPVDKE